LPGTFAAVGSAHSMPLAACQHSPNPPDSIYRANLNGEPSLLVLIRDADVPMDCPSGKQRR
jgi:hypothetical protein